MHLITGSIRRTLISLIFLAVLPALLIILYSGLEQRRSAIENAKSEVLFLARTMGAVQEGVTRSTRQMLATLARMSALAEMDGPAASATFRTVLEQNQDYTNIVALDPRGDVFASGRSFSPTDLSDRPHIRQALAEKAFVVGEYIVARIGEPRPTLAFAFPVLDHEGEPRVVLATVLNLDRFAHFFDVARLPRDSFLAVTDRNGIRLFIHPAMQKTNPIGAPIVASAWEAARNAPGPGISIHEGSDGARRIFAYQPVRLDTDQAPYLYLWAGIPEASVLRPANRILARNLLLMALVAGLALTLACLAGGRMLLSPIKRMISATRAFAGGDHQARSGLGQRPGELGRLAQAFDDMADALQESEAQFRSLVDGAPDAIYVQNGSAFVYVNAAALRLFGAESPEQLLGTPILDRFHPDYHSDIRERIRLLHDERRKVPRRERICLRLDGTPVPVEVSAVPVVFDGHNWSLVFVQDITERKQIEIRLQQAQKMEAIGALAGGIAHDFNNMLFPIIGLSELLLEDLPAGSMERENVVEIHSAARRAGDLVNQILSFSRQAEHKKIPLRIQQVLKEVGKLVRATIPSNITIAQEIQADCGPVLADPTNVHQIAMNLVTNAFHAVEQGGGGIAVGLKQTELTNDDALGISISPGPHALLTVSDTGCGIPPEVLPKIFDPYFTTKAQNKGTGLGLSVVYGIVKEHGGDIRVYSEAGQGTTFKVYLPIIQRDPASNSPATVAVYPTGSERILLVDDEEPIVRMEKQMLERLGYRVTTRTSSVEALEAFSANPHAFDLVITDMAMPNMTGAQLAKQLVRIRAGLPVILCTGFSEQITMSRAGAEGIKGFLMKPLVRGDLAVLVRKVLDEAVPAGQILPPE